jgi:putative nucleotidyltransferase with HDIG domain
MTKSERKPDLLAAKPKPEEGGSIWQILGGQHKRPQLLLVLLAFILTLVIVPKGGFAPGHYLPGDVASRDVKAPRDMLVPDPVLTEKKQAEAEQAILPLYDYDPQVGEEVSKRFKQALELLLPPQDKSVANVPLEDQSASLENLLGASLQKSEVALLKGLAQDPEKQRALLNAIQRTLGNRIVGNLQLFQQDAERGVMVRSLLDQSEEKLIGETTVIGVGNAMNQLEKKITGIKALNREDQKVLLGLLGRLIRPTLTLNKNETEGRKLIAREAVKPVLFQVKKGEMIVREGARVTDDQVLKLKALRALGSDRGALRTALGMMIAMVLVLLVSQRFASENISKFRLNSRDMLFLVTTYIGLFVLIKLAIFLSNSVESAFPYIESSSYYYIFPFAVGAMMVRIVLNSEVALVFSVLTAVFMGFLFGNSLFIALFALTGSMTGAHWVRHCKERNKLYLAGLRISIVNMGVIIGLHLLGGNPFDMQLVYKTGFGFVSGFFCAVIVTALVPLVESLFKYTTDIKLLELSNLNTPVLRQLMVQAPGTYHHSIVVGNLAEAGAEAINANPLLARVAAYYHDIGKVRKPQYFVENQGGHENKHDKLAPSMSALVLIAHVKDGVEIARENNLGNDLIDVLREHHGTALMKFFYEKAKNLQDPEVQQVDERDYRYPGPKPQTREAALIMLADAVEAAGRTLTDPTPSRIQGMVQKIINNIFIDGQLDECELTLKDLHKIAKSFNQILAGIFHYRIDYPEPVHKEKEPAKKKSGDDSNRESTKTAKDQPPDAGKRSSEDLKRLGMS